MIFTYLLDVDPYNLYQLLQHIWDKDLTINNSIIAIFIRK